MRYALLIPRDARGKTKTSFPVDQDPSAMDCQGYCEASSEGQGAIEMSMYSIEYEAGKLQPGLADGPRSHPPAAQARPLWPAGSPEAPGRQPALPRHDASMRCGFVLK